MDQIKVQTKAEFRVSFISPVPLSQGCIIDVVFPDDFTISRSDLTNVQGMNLFGSQRDLPITINSSTRTITISDGCTSYRSSGILGLLDFASIENPISIKTTGSITIEIKDSSQNSIALVTSGVTYTATAGSIQTISITSDNPIVSSITGLNVEFVPEHNLPVESVIELQISDDFQVNETTDCNLDSLITLSSSLS